MQVPVFDLSRQNQLLEGQLQAAFTRVVASGQFILGEEVKLFETEMASFLNVKHAIGVANGSDALVLALLALGSTTGR